MPSLPVGGGSAPRASLSVTRYEHAFVAQQWRPWRRHYIPFSALLAELPNVDAAHETAEAAWGEMCCLVLSACDCAASFAERLANDALEATEALAKGGRSDYRAVCALIERVGGFAETNFAAVDRLLIVAAGLIRTRGSDGAALVSRDLPARRDALLSSALSSSPQLRRAQLAANGYPEAVRSKRPLGDLGAVRRRATKLGVASGATITLFVIVLVTIVRSPVPLWGLSGFSLVLPPFTTIFLPALAIGLWGCSACVMDHLLLDYRKAIGKSGLAPSQLWKVSLVCCSVVMALFTVTVGAMANVLNITQSRNFGGAACVAVLVFGLASLLAPVHVFHRSARVGLLRRLGGMLVLPFGRPSFIDGLFADVLTSLSAAFRHAAVSACVAYTGGYGDLTSSSALPPACSGGAVTLSVAVSMLPYVWRFFQCLNALVRTGHWWPHAANAGKYACSLVTIGLAGLVAEEENASLERLWRELWLCAVPVSTLYSFLWDVFVDWRLVVRRDGKFRPRECAVGPITVSAASILDLILRFAWISTVTPSITKLFPASPALGLLLAVLELVRRFVWVVLRIDNALAS